VISPGVAVLAVAVVLAVTVVALPGGSGAYSAAGAPQTLPGRVRVGVSGASAARSAVLTRRLGLSPTLTGRTFELSDTFNQQWALTAESRGGVPWITLVLTHRGRAGLAASLTAVSNGVDDGGLHRWASALARFGRPVYLTMLPEVDRNFAASSAVARGGIPQDVRPAWQHLRRVFAAAGASNVAWVWNPADPGHDIAYAPPAAQVDDVAVTLFEYPHTSWVSPAAALDAAARRHPGKHLLVEVSAAGTPAAPVGRSRSGPRTRAAWITALAADVSARGDVAGVVYHDSGPYQDPTDPAARPWALTSDRVSLAAAGYEFRQLQSGRAPVPAASASATRPRPPVPAASTPPPSGPPTTVAKPAPTPLLTAVPVVMLDDAPTCAPLSTRQVSPCVVHAH